MQHTVLIQSFFTGGGKGGGSFSSFSKRSEESARKIGDTI